MSDENKDTSVGSEEKKPTTEEKIIKVPESLLEQMNQEIEDLKVRAKKTDALLGNDIIEDDKDKSRIARMRIYNGKLVIGYNKEKGTWMNYDKMRREDRLTQEITLRDDEGKITEETVDYLRFFEEAKTIELPVIKVDKKEFVEEKGLIRTREVVDYKTVMKKDKVMQKVVSSQDTFTIKLKDGTELKLDMAFINM